MRGAWLVQASTSSERCNCTWPLCLKQAPVSHYQADLPANQWLGSKGAKCVSTESLRIRVSQLQKQRAQLESSLSRERDNVRKKKAEINQVSRSITKNTSQSMLQSKQRQIESKERQLSGYQKKVADLTNKIASKDAEILRKLSDLEKAETQAQRKKDQEEKRRRDVSLRHTRDVTRELERQSRLHNRMSNSPIIVKFEDLPKQITVLFIASNPSDQTQLRLDEEIRDIQKKNQSVRFPGVA